MTKEHVIKAALSLINIQAKKYGLEIIDKGTGHAFDNTFWSGYLTDDSNIPEVSATNDNYSIGLRLFWGSPKIDIRRQVQDGEELLIFHFSDSKKVNNKYIHTGNFRPHEIRVDARWDYTKCIQEIYTMIDYIEGYKE